MSEPKKVKWTLSTLLRNATASKVLSVLIAVCLWFFVVYAIDNEDIKTIHDVPVNIDETSLSSLGLSVIEGGDATVTVEVSGKRYDIGNLTENDIRIRAALGVVKGAGKYELAVEPVVDSSLPYTVQIKGDSTIWVTFDREISKEIQVTADINGLSVPEDYLLGTVEVSPSTITIQGPEKEVSMISKAVVHTEFSDPLTQSQIIPAEILYLDKEGEVVTSTHVTRNVETADIIIPVKKTVELPLTLSFTNVPNDLDVDELKYTLSNESIWVAAPEDAIKNHYEIMVGNINFEDLDLTQQNVFTFEVKLPDGFVNVNNIETVVVEFDNSDYTSKYLNLNHFTITNVPPNYVATSATSALNNVKVIGTEAALKNIKASDFVVEVNFSDREVQLGQYEMPVSIYAPGKGTVWAVGSYSAVVNVQEKPQ